MSNGGLNIPFWIVAEMVAHARREAPIECCGLLAGNGSVVRSIYPLVNEAASPTAYRVSTGLLAPFKAMRAASEELLAIYHSHPHGTAVPSRTDLSENFYPTTIHVIISLVGDEPTLRAYLLGPDYFVEVPWQTIPCHAL